MHTKILVRCSPQSHFCITAACAIIKDTAATGNTSRFADTAVFPSSIWTAAIRSETEAEGERERVRPTDRQTATRTERERERAREHARERGRNADREREKEQKGQ